MRLRLRHFLMMGLEFLIVLFYSAFVAFKHGRGQKSVALLPGAGWGSSGDEAMVIGVSEALKTVDVDIRIIDYHSNDQKWSENPLGFLPENYRQWPELIDRLSKCEWCIVNGADVLDGRYNYFRSVRRILVALAGGIVCQGATITGFSFRNNAPPSLRWFLRFAGRYVHLKIRDEVSQSRLPNVPTELVADMAFLMPPVLADVDIPTLEEIKVAKKAGARILAANLSFHSITSISKLSNEEAIVAFMPGLTAFFGRVLEEFPDMHILFLPHDSRGGDHRDFALQERLISGLPDHLKVRTISKPEPLHPASLKQLLSETIGLITGRKHLAVAGLGVGIPCFGFEYNDKFEGLFKRFSLDHSLITIGSENWESDLLKKGIGFINNLSKYRPEVEKRRVIETKDSMRNLREFFESKKLRAGK